MLKRMKDELTKSKGQNSRLQAEVEKLQRGGADRGVESEAPTGWEAERQALRREIEEMQGNLKGSLVQLERQMREVRSELDTAQEERDHVRASNEQLTKLTQQAQSDMEKLRGDNLALEHRALDAENKVSLLLDQVESSVDNYRRQSASLHVNGGTTSASRGHAANDSLGGESNFSSTTASIHTGERNSMALDSLASELETLRTQWEGTHKTYRLSNNFDFERSPSNGAGGELSNSLASWRKRLDAEEKDKEVSGRVGK